MNYQIVPMNAAHLAPIAALERACFSQPWSEEMLAEELRSDCASFLVAQSGSGSVMGYAGLHVVLDEGYIDNVAVAEGFRRQGVADALLAMFLKFGRANLAFLTLEVRKSNRAAIDLYLKNGFAQVAARKDYYKNPTEDAIIMTLEFERDV